MSIADICAAIGRMRLPTIIRQQRGHHRFAAAVQLHYVSAGHKPAYLWDSGPLCGRPEPIGALVAALRTAGLIAADMRVVRLHDDVLVVNRRTLQRLDLEAVCFVDVSAAAGVPRPVGEGTRAELVRECEAVRRQICGGDALMECVVRTSACVPTVFGVLVGYPICYWYAAASPASDENNCLAGERLSVFQLWHEDDHAVVTGNSGGGQGIPVFSMSCAERLLLGGGGGSNGGSSPTGTDDDGLDRRVSAWFRRRAAESGLRYRVVRSERLERVVL